MSAPIMSRFDLFFVVLDECNETTDYNIALHIVNVHRLRQEAIRPEFTTDQLRRYIQFARTFHPKLTHESRDLLRELYRNLRQTDAYGTGHNAYRITVRQLESLIRLSEALARVHCDEFVHTKYVREAYRLLQKSIIHVEQQDVTLDDIQQQEQQQQQQQQPEQPEQPTRRSQVTRINRDHFDKIKDALVYKIRSQEEQDDTTMLTKSQLVEWYIEQQMEEFETEQEKQIGRKLVAKVIRHLVKKDEILIELRNVEDEQDEDEDDPMITVHPNYVQD